VRRAQGSTRHPPQPHVFIKFAGASLKGWVEASLHHIHHECSSSTITTAASRLPLAPEHGLAPPCSRCWASMHAAISCHCFTEPQTLTYRVSPTPPRLVTRLCLHYHWRVCHPHHHHCATMSIVAIAQDHTRSNHLYLDRCAGSRGARWYLSFVKTSPSARNHRSKLDLCSMWMEGGASWPMGPSVSTSGCTGPGAPSSTKGFRFNFLFFCSIKCVKLVKLITWSRKVQNWWNQFC
jgi:hypothetical protein